jgi:serine/threonine-protein kinase
MGTVHLGRVVGAGGFSRVVAIKRLFPRSAEDAAFRDMLLEEARLVSRIRHPNVVPALDVVEVDHDLYIVMEYVDGPSLSQLLARARKLNEPIPLEIVIGIAEGILHGLHAAHEARGEDGTPLGIVHRDVSPQNILVGSDGVARLIDFGIAKAATRIQVTDPGVVKGKIAYMAPEQFLSQTVSRHADVYACSVVLWEALANRRLFEGRSQELDQDSGAGTSIRRAFEAKAPAPTQHRNAVHEAIDRVVLRGLELEPADRFQTAEAMALALRGAQPAASSVDIARWLERSAPDELELAEERVRLFEQTSQEVQLVAAPPKATASIDGSWAAPTGDEPRLGSTVRWITIGGSMLGVAIVALAFGTRTRLPAAAIATAPSPVSRSSPQPTAVAPDPVEPLVPSASPAVSAMPSSVPVKRAAPRPSKSDCDPPYTIDGTGHKHYHPKCF